MDFLLKTCERSSKSLPKNKVPTYDFSFLLENTKINVNFLNFYL